MQDRDHTFTVAMHPGETQPTLHGPYWDLKRATDIAEMLSLFTGRMHRPLNITYIIDDNPAVMLPYAQRERMVELGQAGECASNSVEPRHPNLHLTVFLPQTTARPSSSSRRTRRSPTLRKRARPTRPCGGPSGASSRPTTAARRSAPSCGTTRRSPTCACTPRRASCTGTRCSRACRSARSCPSLRLPRCACTRTFSRRLSSSGRRTMSATSRPGRARA